MDNQLTILIWLYEDEKARLEKLIHECLKEAEYLMAHCHSKALSPLNDSLRKLHRFDDNLYDEKSLRLTRTEVYPKNDRHRGLRVYE